jgi:hypothetical protein
VNTRRISNLVNENYAKPVNDIGFGYHRDLDETPSQARGILGEAAMGDKPYKGFRALGR